MNPREIIERFVAYSPLFVDSDGRNYCNFCSEEFERHDDVRRDFDAHRDNCVWANAKRYLEERHFQLFGQCSSIAVCDQDKCYPKCSYYKYKRKEVPKGYECTYPRDVCVGGECVDSSGSCVHLRKKETKMNEGIHADAVFEATLIGIVTIRAKLVKEVGDLLAVCPQPNLLSHTSKIDSLMRKMEQLDEAWRIVKEKKDARDR